MSISIHIVVNLPIIRDLAVCSTDPVLVPQGVCLIGAIPRPVCTAILEGAVQPVYASVTHANSLTLSLQTWKTCVTPVSCWATAAVHAQLHLILVEQVGTRASSCIK